MKTQWSKSMGCSKSSSKREVYSDTRLPQETREISNKQPNPILKGTTVSPLHTNEFRSESAFVSLICL